MEIWNSYVQLMKKNSEKLYEKHPVIKCARKTFCLLSPNKKRIRRKVIITTILEKGMGKNIREKMNRNNCIEEAKIPKEKKKKKSKEERGRRRWAKRC